MNPFKNLSKEGGVVNIDFSGHGDSAGLTLQMIAEHIASLPTRVRLDEITVSPTMIDGKLVLQFEASRRHRHAADDNAMYLDVE
jgi:hypothetical protein